MSARLQIGAMYAPAIVLFCAFVFYPLLSGVRISFTDWNGYSQSYSYIGLDHFRKLFADANVRTAFINTLVYGIGSTLIQNVWGLLYALLFNRKFPGRTMARDAVYLPVMVSGLIMGYIWYFLLQYSGGALNDVLIAIGLSPIDWLADQRRARSFCSSRRSSTSVRRWSFTWRDCRRFRSRITKRPIWTASGLGAGFGTLRSRFWRRPS